MILSPLCALPLLSAPKDWDAPVQEVCANVSDTCPCGANAKPCKWTDDWGFEEDPPGVPDRGPIPGGDHEKAGVDSVVTVVHGWTMMLVVTCGDQHDPLKVIVVT